MSEREYLTQAQSVHALSTRLAVRDICWQYEIRQQRRAEDPRPSLRTLEGCRVEMITRKEAERIILPYEWLGTVGRASLCAGLYREDELLGALCFGWPAAPESRDVCGRELRQQAICLERGACVHWAPPNAASFLISHALKLVNETAGYEIFYAYADVSAGEIGNVYQACNWHYIGQGVGRTPGRWREHFRRPDGSVVSGRTLRHMGLLKNEVMQSGWEMILIPPKHKYVYFAGDRRRRRQLVRLCRYPFLPYPKRPYSTATQLRLFEMSA